MTTQDRLGNSVRGFEVIVIRPKHKYNLRYPILNGQDTIKTMTTLKTRGFDSYAQTESFGIVEQLTLDEMIEIVI